MCKKVNIRRRKTMKKIIAGACAASLMLSLAAPAFAEGPVSSEEAYEIFSQAYAGISATDAYESTIDTGLILSGGAVTIPVQLVYKVRDTGTECDYYYSMDVLGSVSETYYSDGVMYNVPGADGAEYTATPMSYEDFVAQNNTSAVFMDVNMDAEDFAAAEISETDGIITATFTIPNTTGFPAMLLSYAKLFGFDPDTCTDIVYDDMIVDLVYTREGVMKTLGIYVGVDYKNAEGTPGDFAMDIDMNVNALGDAVVVPTYTPPKEPEPVDDGDLAKKGTAFADSVNNAIGETATPDKINDGDGATRWQSEKTMAANAEELAGKDPSGLPYFGIAWEETVTIDAMKMQWETAGPNEGGIEIYYTLDDVDLTKNTEPDGTSNAGKTWYSDGNTKWIKLDASQYTLVRTETLPEGVKYASEDTVTFKTPLKAKGIKIVGTVSSAKTKELSIFDITITGEGSTGGEIPQTGVASVTGYLIVLAVAAVAAAVALKAKKVRE